MTAVAGPAPLTAGVSASLTGQFATQGRQALAGLAAWVEYVNKSGGIVVDGRRHPVALRHFDDGSRADAARRNTERLLAGGVDLLFGPYSAGLTTAVAEVSAAYGRLLWNHGGAGDAVYGRNGGYVVGILTPANRYLAGLPALVRSVCADAGALAIARVDTGAFARQVCQGAETAAGALGFETILRLSYPPDTVDFAGIAGQIAAAAPDVLVAVGRIQHDIALARALTAAAQYRRAAIGLAAVVATPIAAFAEALGADADGFVGPSQWEPQVAVANPDFGPPPGAAMSLLQRAADAHSVPVDYPMAQAFAAGLVAQRCLTEAGVLDDAGLYDAASAADFTTFYGRFRIDGAGRQVGRGVALVQRQGGRKVVVWPPEQADGRAQWGF